MLKKTTIAVLGLAASGYALAGTMGPTCAPGNVTVPCEAKGWDLGVQALYLRPVVGADRARVSSARFTPSRIENLKYDFDWGFKLDGSYHFNTGNDATLSWLHYQESTGRSGLTGLDVAVFLGSQLQVQAPIPMTLSNKNNFDQVNMVMGQLVQFSAADKLRFYSGLQYAHMYENRTYLLSNSLFAPLPTGQSFNQLDNSEYKGLGPVIGIDYAYYLAQSLSVTANGAGSILYGKNRSINTYVLNPVGGLAFPRFYNKLSMVPSLEAKVGLNYDYRMNQGVLSVLGGFQAINYFNALQTLGPDSILAPKLSAADYGLYGPYFGVKYLGNA